MAIAVFESLKNISINWNSYGIFIFFVDVSLLFQEIGRKYEENLTKLDYKTLTVV